MFRFTLIHQARKSRARCGQLQTPHGTLSTPAFVFCATKGAIKGVSTETMRSLNTAIILSNTYHLHVYPGYAWVAKHGGLHKIMDWSGPMMTDSGGFQIFSLGHGGVSQEIKGKGQNRKRYPVKITEKGATFRSYRDGSSLTLTPELSMTIQHALGADLVMPLDECTPFHQSYRQTQEAMERSHRWEMRSLKMFQKLNTSGQQTLYGIVQGGVHPDLRQQSVDFVNQTGFWGQAIGGSLGRDHHEMHDVVSRTSALMDPARPKHLLGIGYVRDILHGVRCGLDTFDCVHPTRLARHGGALITAHYWQDANEPIHTRESLNISRSLFADDQRPIDDQCLCPTCQQYTRAYLHYLWKSQELLALTALTIHNVFYMNRLMAEIRAHIPHDTLDQVYHRFLAPSP